MRFFFPLQFFKIYFIDNLTVVPIFLLGRPLPGTPIPSSNPLPQFMTMGHAYKFFGFSISYTVLNNPLSCTYQFVLLNPCTLSLILLLPLLDDNPPNDLHIYDSVPVLLVCLVFQIQLLIDMYFFAILLFIVLIFFFLNKSL